MHLHAEEAWDCDAHGYGEVDTGIDYWGEDGVGSWHEKHLATCRTTDAIPRHVVGCFEMLLAVYARELDVRHNTFDIGLPEMRQRPPLE